MYYKEYLICIFSCSLEACFNLWDGDSKIKFIDESKKGGNEYRNKMTSILRNKIREAQKFDNLEESLSLTYYIIDSDL
jgi:hypothetical protein